MLEHDVPQGCNQVVEQVAEMRRKARGERCVVALASCLVGGIHECVSGVLVDQDMNVNVGAEAGGW